MTSNISKFGWAVIAILIAGSLAGAKFGYDYFFPKKVKEVTITTKTSGLPTLDYDKGSNAPFREFPQLNEHVDVESKEVRGWLMAWNGAAAINYAVGGTATSKGSICEELGLNIQLSVHNSCTEQANGLYSFTEAMANGDPNPSAGCHFINWMGDGVPGYFDGLHARIVKDFGVEYRPKIYTFTGASFGEDKWMLKKKYEKDARGSLTVTVIRDGDWNLAVAKSNAMGWDINYDNTTFDPTKVNFYPAPNDDFIEAGKMYINGTKITLKLVKNGIVTDEDTTLAPTGVGTWFPVDQQIAESRGGLITAASTKEFSGQMACAIVFISKWADENPDLMEKMIEAFGLSGDQIKSHDEALRFASQVSEIVYADPEKDADAWYNAFKSFPLRDADDNEIIIGGSRAFNIADAAAYTGVGGGTDKYKKVYNTFGSLITEAYPELISGVPAYTDAVDWKYLKAVYNKAKSKGIAGEVSKPDFTKSKKGEIVGDAKYSIQFNVGSDEILPASYPVLDGIVAQLNIAENTFVEVVGHTDNTGDSLSNIELSKARAASIKQYFIEQDSDLGAPKKIKTDGKGQSQPLPNVNAYSKEGRALNRRVEIKLYSVQ